MKGSTKRGIGAAATALCGWMISAAICVYALHIHNLLPGAVAIIVWQAYRLGKLEC